jgi:hypothetical protein
MRRSIKLKVLAAQVGTIVVMALFLRGVGYRIVSRVVFDLRREQQMLLLRTGRDLFEYRLSDYRKRFKEIAANEITTVYAKKFNAPMLYEYWAAFQDEFPVLSFVNAKGLEEFKLVDGEISQQLDNIRMTPLFQNAMRTPGSVVVSPAILDGQKGPTVRFAMNVVTFFDEFIAVITADIPLANATEVFADHAIGETGTAFLVDHQGVSPSRAIYLSGVNRTRQ